MLIALGKVAGNISLDGTTWLNISIIGCFMTVIFLVIFQFKPARTTTEETLFVSYSKWRMVPSEAVSS